MSPTQALFWKEWRQIQWRWVFCLVMCCLFVFIGLKTRIMEDEAIMVFGFLGCAFLMPLFIAMGLVAEEREQGSMRMQLALPVSIRRVYCVKISLGALAITILIMTVLFIILIVAADREESTGYILRTFGFAVPFGAIFMLWTVVFSIKRKTQWAAALTGIVIVACWMFLALFEEMFISRIGKGHLNFSQVITPLGVVFAGPGRGPWQVTVIVQTLVSIGLFWWGMKRFSSLSRSSK
jgi:ABC-type transport system involved in multi-copper enzyme maturation permease subunit